MNVLYLCLAAIFFSAGGLITKLSAGATKAVPTFAFLALFLAGALLQAIAMKRAPMGPVYLSVLGLEAAFTIFFSVLVLHESVSWLRALAVCLIVTGVGLLRVA